MPAAYQSDPACLLKYYYRTTCAKNWMMHRMDPPQDPTREAMLKGVVPMLAKLAPGIPTGSDWAFEIKWDGVRCIAYIDGGRLRLESRNRNDISAQYPELRPLGESLGALEVVLDGEIVAFDNEGKPSFQRLQNRLGLKGTAVLRRSKEVPVVFVIFDLLYLDGHSTMPLSYRDRRTLLERLDLNGEAWRVPAFHDDGQALFAATKERNLEGVIAKRLASVYEPGRRSGSWLKVKNHLHQPFIVCGWNQRENASGDAIGAIALGYYEGGELLYAGRVGTGFTEESARQLLGQLRPLSRATSPFARAVPDPPSHYVEAVVVVDVEFFEWTEDGVLRHPSFKGVRPDHRANDVTREAP